MRTSIGRGFTLPETLIVILVVALVLTTLIAITTQASRVYSMTSSRIEPQATQMLVLKRMEREMREAMLVDVVSSNASWVQVVMPLKDETTGMNLLVKDPNSELLLLQPGRSVYYFVGSLWYPNPNDKRNWYAVPYAGGRVLFRADDSIIPVSGMYPNAEILLKADNALPANDAHPELTTVAFFRYTPADDNGTPDNPFDDKPTLNTRLLTVTLTLPIRELTGSGFQMQTHSLQSQFCFRNFATLEQGP